MNSEFRVDVHTTIGTMTAFVMVRREKNHDGTMTSLGGVTSILFVVIMGLIHPWRPRQALPLTRWIASTKTWQRADRECYRG